ncbi:MAG: octanoyltransferase [Chloroflexus sp.]|nr:MAG: octanoyltransferase [Chloroflexus sp.]
MAVWCAAAHQFGIYCRSSNIDGVLYFKQSYRYIFAFTTMMRTLTVYHLGHIDYTTAWEMQRRLARQRSSGQIGDTILLLEHPPTITLGNKARPEHIIATPAELAARGVAIVQSDRGGEVTYHAPGQLVAYPIFKLSQHGSDVGRYVRGLEESVIRVLAGYGLTGERVNGLTGVWVRGGAAKICAIGVKLSASGVTTHGLALNVDPDLSGFELIVPCGISDRGVTSLAVELGKAPPMAEVADRLIAALCAIFDLRPVNALS